MEQLDFYYSPKYDVYFYDDSLYEAYDIYSSYCNKNQLENKIKDILVKWPMLNIEEQLLDSMLEIAEKNGFDIEENSTIIV